MGIDGYPGFYANSVQNIPDNTLFDPASSDRVAKGPIWRPDNVAITRRRLYQQITRTRHAGDYGRPNHFGVPGGVEIAPQRFSSSGS